MKDAQGGREPPMGPRNSPWIEVPDDWVDDKYSRHEGYRAFQEYFGLLIKPDVINEYLTGKGILPNVKIDVVRFAALETAGRLGIDATLMVTGTTRTGGYGTDTIEIYRTIDLADKHCRFDKLGASTVNLEGFGVEYYRRAIPLLKKLGIEKIKTMPLTAPEESPELYQFVGAYIWSFYGYTNSTMAGTLDRYIDYLKKVRKIKLTSSAEADKRDLPRMLYLATDRVDGEETGKMFLLGLDAHNNPTRAILWKGVHNNIQDESASNKEMTELVNYLSHKIKEN